MDPFLLSEDEVNDELQIRAITLNGPLQFKQMLLARSLKNELEKFSPDPPLLPDWDTNLELEKCLRKSSELHALVSDTDPSNIPHVQIVLAKAHYLYRKISRVPITPENTATISAVISRVKELISSSSEIVRKGINANKRARESFGTNSSTPTRHKSQRSEQPNEQISHENQHVNFVNRQTESYQLQGAASLEAQQAASLIPNYALLNDSVPRNAPHPSNDDTMKEILKLLQTLQVNSIQSQPINQSHIQQQRPVVERNNVAQNVPNSAQTSYANPPVIVPNPHLNASHTVGQNLSANQQPLAQYPPIQNFRGPPPHKWNISHDGINKRSLKTFLKTYETLGKSQNFSDAELRFQLPYVLKDRAKQWYVDNMHRFTTFEDAKRGILEHYLEPNHDYYLKKEIEARQQGDKERFITYYDEMVAMFNCLDNPPSTHEQVLQIYDNCLPDLKSLLSTHIDFIESLDVLVASGKRLDGALRDARRRAQTDKKVNFKYHKVNEIFNSDSDEEVCVMTRFNKDKKPDGANYDDRRCFNCGSKQHYAANCPHVNRRVSCRKCGKQCVNSVDCQCDPNDFAQENRKVFCHKCGKQGVKFSDCECNSKNLKGSTASQD